MNATGVVAFGPLAATPDEIVERLFRINTLGALWLAKAAIPALTKSQGFLVHISGIIADMPMPGLVTYSVLVGSPPALPKGRIPTGWARALSAAFRMVSGYCPPRPSTPRPDNSVSTLPRTSERV